MATKKLEDYSLQELEKEKEIREKSRRNINLFWLFFFALAIITAVWRLQQEVELSKLAGLFAVLFLSKFLMTYGVNERLKKIKLEIQKRR